VKAEFTTIKQHYERCWGPKSELAESKKGLVWQLPPGFGVLVFHPNERRKMWTYATCGMSQQSDAIPLELHLFSPVQTDLHVELLTAVAHYHVTGEYLDLGHTVNFGRGWLPGSKCDHGLTSLPYLDGPSLEWFEGAKRKIRFLWLIPITPSELKFKKAHGSEALESRFDSSKFNYLDRLRESVV
jgi:hypothetical protein